MPLYQRILLLIPLLLSLYAQVELLRVISWYEGQFGYLAPFRLEQALLILGIALNSTVFTIIWGPKRPR